jgi:Protein of unknown function (DUF3579)
MNAAAQQQAGTIAAATAVMAVRGMLGHAVCDAEAGRAAPTTMSAPERGAREFIIHGVTQDGRTFRPSDWAERLAGAMSSFRPGSAGKAGIGAYIGYSPFCVPTTVGTVKAVIVSEALRDIEPMAWDFVINFARDNNLQFGEVCLMPEPMMKRP